MSDTTSNKLTDNASNNKTTNNSTNNSKSGRKRKQFLNSTPVFRVTPDGSERGILKYVGIVNENEKLGDEVVELEKAIHPEHDIWGENTLPLKKIGPFDVMGIIYRCNIVGSHVVVSRRYPVMYLDVYYEKSMVSGSLFQIFFSFDMNPEDKREIKDTKKYVNLRFGGKWFRHIDCDEELIQNFDKMITPMLENDGAQIFYTSTDPDIISKRETFTEDEIAGWIENYINTEKLFYEDLFKEKQTSFRTLRKLRDWFVELSQTERFSKFVQIAMKCREIHRKKEHGFDEDSKMFDIPKIVTKLDDVRLKMIENDELIMDDDTNSDNNE